MSIEYGMLVVTSRLKEFDGKVALRRSVRAISLVGLVKSVYLLT
jgi:hypothetical protein